MYIYIYIVYTYDTRNMATLLLSFHMSASSCPLCICSVSSILAHDKLSLMRSPPNKVFQSHGQWPNARIGRCQPPLQVGKKHSLSMDHGMSVPEILPFISEKWNELGEFSKCDLKTSLFFNFSINQVDTHAKSFGMNPLWLHIPTHKPLDLAMVDHTSRVRRPKHRKRKPSKHGMIWINLSVPGPTLFASYWNSDIFSIHLGTDPPASVHSVSLPDFP